MAVASRSSKPRDYHNVVICYNYGALIGHMVKGLNSEATVTVINIPSRKLLPKHKDRHIVGVWRAKEKHRVIPHVPKEDRSTITIG